MNSNVPGVKRIRPFPLTSKQAAGLFVWGIWSLMFLSALGLMVRYGRNIPLAEDWLLVKPLTGHEQNLLAWFWQQNNEHRLPLGRLIMLSLLKISNGDFRAGMLFNIVSLSGLSAAMILVAHRIRGGVTQFSDAFFPLAILHLGNWENLFWSWQLSFVISVILACIVLLSLVVAQQWRPAIWGGSALILLPLTGATGLVFVPIPAAWFFYCGMRLWLKSGSQRSLSIWLISSPILAVILSGIYFIGYEKPEWVPPNPGVVPSLVTAVQFQALAFGSAATNSWTFAIIAMFVIILLGGFVLLRGAFSKKVETHSRAWGLLSFWMVAGLVALAMGYGRAAGIAIDGRWPQRYALLAVPAFCTVYYAWILFGQEHLRKVVQLGMLVSFLLVLPANIKHGFFWRDWYVNEMDRLAGEIEAGTPRYAIAERYQEFLIHWWSDEELAENMQLLHDAKMGPFVNMQPDPIYRLDPNNGNEYLGSERLYTQEIWYHGNATAVFLVWGINKNWQLLPPSLRPTNTTLTESGVMKSPMNLINNTFVVELQIPDGTTLNYGFLIDETNDGTFAWYENADYHQVVEANGRIEITK